MIIDIIVLVILLISAGIAFMRGAIREILTIAGVFGGLAASYFGAPMLKPHMRGWFGVEEGVVPERLFGVLPYDVLADVLSYGLIFIVVVTVLSFISHSLAEWARRVGLGAVDRSFGFLFGLVRGVLLLGIIYLLPYLFFDKVDRDEFMQESRSQFYLEKVAGAMSSYWPEDAEEATEQAMEQAETIMDAREKLEEIELLKGTEDTISVPDMPESEELNGYSEEFRDGMDQLIDEQSRRLNE